MHFLANLVSQNSTEGYKFNDSQTLSSNSNRNPYVETMKEDIKLAVKERPGFKNPDESILKKLLDSLGLSKVSCKEKKKTVIAANISETRNVFDCDLGGSYEKCTCGQR